MSYKHRPHHRPDHQHFCSMCFTKRGRLNRNGDRGWWKCREARCLRLNASMCPEHQQMRGEGEARRDEG